MTVDAGGFAGPSAGLALALHIYERLTGEPLAGGRRIAAARAGADFFLVPEANAAEAAAAAEAAGGGMAVAGVRTFEEAVNLLRAHRVQEGRTMIGGS